MTSRSRCRVLGRKWWLPVPAAVALIAVAVSCGGDDACPEGKPAPSPSPAALRGTATPGEEEDLTRVGRGRAPAAEGKRTGGAEDAVGEDFVSGADSGRVPIAGRSPAGTEGDGTLRTAAGEGQAPGGFVPVVPELVAEADGVRVTLKRVADPYDDPFSEPGPGTRFVAFDLTLERIAGGSLQRPREQDFRLVDAARAEYSGRFVTAAAVGLLESVQITLAFTVSGRATPKLLTYDPDPASPGKIEFALSQ